MHLLELFHTNARLTFSIRKSLFKFSPLLLNGWFDCFPELLVTRNIFNIQFSKINYGTQVYRRNCSLIFKNKHLLSSQERTILSAVY